MWINELHPWEHSAFGRASRDRLQSAKPKVDTKINVNCFTAIEPSASKFSPHIYDLPLNILRLLKMQKLARPIYNVFLLGKSINSLTVIESNAATH